MKSQPLQTSIPLTLITILIVAGAVFNIYPKGHWQLVPVIAIGFILACIMSTEEKLPKIFVALPLSGILLSGNDFSIGNYIVDWKICTTGIALTILLLCRKTISLSKSQLKTLCAGLLPGILCVSAGSLLAQFYYQVGIYDVLQLLLSLAQALILLAAIYITLSKRRTSLFLAAMTVLCILMAGRI